MLNLRIACSLLYLLASTKDELSKTKELRTNMELFLQDIKEENRRKDSGRDKLMFKESPASSAATSCLTTDLKEVSRCSSLLLCCRYTTAPYLLQEEDSIPGSRRSIVCDEPRKEEGMEQLEAELETELERFQFLNEAPIPVYRGVSPIELERKLHELLESRQQEKIKELKADVECITQKLSEKEREATWWKDTALLVSHHVPEPTGSSLDAILGKL